MNNITLPPFIMTSEKGSFAQMTIRDRKPQIINMILSVCDFTPDIQEAFHDFKHELACGSIRPLHENASDREVWMRDMAPWLEKSWFEIPWFLAEAYFYRRVLEITRYFQPGPYIGLDPFEHLKSNEILDEKDVFVDLYPKLAELRSMKGFWEFCVKSLWGNRGDLSFMDHIDPSMGTQAHRIILDQLDVAYQFLSSVKPAKIAYFFDNVGKELCFDLALIDHLFQTGLAGKVTCYLKNQPYFVSDAMPKDMMKTINQMSNSTASEVRQLSQRLIDGIKSGKIQVEAPPFLTFGLMYREMPQDFRAQLRSQDVAILKGDVNYRRLMDDRHWPPTTPVEVAGGYFPTAFLSLRTLKSELVVGLTSDILNKVESEADPDWLINGKRGLITFHKNVVQKVCINHQTI